MSSVEAMKQVNQSLNPGNITQNNKKQKHPEGPPQSPWCQKSRELHEVPHVMDAQGEDDPAEG